MTADAFVSYRNYPYVNARVRARRADLVTDAEYRKLVKMDLSEVAEFLGKRGYGPEVEDLGATYSGGELVEKAVRANLGRTYRELVRMAPEPVQKLLTLYFQRLAIENLKIILRAVATGTDISDMLTPTQEMDRAEMERLQEIDTMDAVLEAFDLSGDSDLDTYIDDRSDLQAVEDGLDRFYYAEIVDQVDAVGGKSELFGTFLELEAVLKNVALVLRMVRRGADYEEIVDRLIPVPATRGIDPEELASLGTEQEILQRLRETPVGEFLEEETPAEVQRALEQYKLQQGVRLLHQDQLGVNPVLGFMICKEVEAKNLRMLARAKQEDLGEAFINRNLVTGVAS